MNGVTEFVRVTRRNPFTESALVSALVLAVVLPLSVTYYCLSQPLKESYWTDLVGEQFRKELGFATGLISIPGERDAKFAPLRIFGITRVSDGGTFAKAGVRAGDLPNALAVSGYGPGCTKGPIGLRELCRAYLGGPCLLTGLAAAVRQEQVGVMFYSTLRESQRLGHFRFSVISASDLVKTNWQQRARLVDVALR